MEQEAFQRPTERVFSRNLVRASPAHRGADATMLRRCSSARLAAVPREAQDLFATRCGTCHGSDGTGNGPAGAALNPHPRNFTDAAWQAQVTDEQLRTIIVSGGAAVGKSPLMPANPDLQGNTRMVDGLVAMVRTFRP